jgi:uncharacterized protein (TIGR02679 family)
MEEADLLRFLERPELQRLWREARDRLERLGGVRGTVRLPDVGDPGDAGDAGAAERRAVADLLGLATLPRGDLKVRLDRLDRALQESRFGVGLRAALERLGGPLRDRAGEQRQERLRRAALWAEAAAHPAVAARPALLDWLDDLRSSGLLRRLAAGGGEERRLLEQAFAVLSALSRPGVEIRLPVLANEVLGASHALDPGRPVATLVTRALARLADRPPPGDARARRELWEKAGVIPDDLSGHVLLLGLAPAGGGRVGEGLRAFAAAGEPVKLTLRQLAAGLAFPGVARIHVCENPVVVAAAADRWGAACPPLACLEGFPSFAARRLLADLAKDGAEVLYHGDFDWAGLAVANSLREAVPFRPWRFTAADYRAAVATAGEPAGLAGRPVDAAWDPGLAAAMAEAGAAVEEETVLGELLEDLRPG